MIGGVFQKSFHSPGFVGERDLLVEVGPRDGRVDALHRRVRLEARVQRELRQTAVGHLSRFLKSVSDFRIKQKENLNVTFIAFISQ
jgi:hypothetical protein